MAQIALLRDILLDQSPWAHLVSVNWLTPYLLGYLPGALLALMMPADMGVRLLLSIGLLVFVAVGGRWISYFGSPPRSIWLFIPGYFGFAWTFGFLTFLLAVPIGLLFILQGLRCIDTPSFRSGVALFCLGVTLSFSHFLVFIYVLTILAACLTVSILERTRLARRINERPTTIFILATVAVILVATLASPTGGQLVGQRLLFLPIAMNYSFVDTLALNYSFVDTPSLIATSILVAGFLLICQLRLPPLSHGVILLTFCAGWLLLPSDYGGVGYVYQRFSIFMWPFVVVLFASAALNNRTRLGAILLVMGVAGSLVLQGQRLWRANLEAAPLTEVLQELPPSKRILRLVDSHWLGLIPESLAIVHMPVMYQVLKRGWVDFNFASYPTQVARFRPDQRPYASSDYLTSELDKFDWHTYQAEIYDYIIIGGAMGDIGEWVFRTAPCRPHLYAHRGVWAVYEVRPCQDQR
jgi:hypothetical protein